MAAGSLPLRKRRPHRRDEILTAAAELFHRHGFEATGIDDIGAAVGITGPGVYRHFRSKQDILETLLAMRGTAAMDAMQAIVDRADEPRATLAALVRYYADTLAAYPSEVVVAMYERRTLADKTRATIEALERQNIDAWVSVLMRVRPELSEPEARTLVQGALSMGVAVANYESGLAPSAVAPLVASMMESSLGLRAPRGGGRASRRR